MAGEEGSLQPMEVLDFQFAARFKEMQDVVCRDNEEKGLHDMKTVEDTGIPNELYLPTKLSLIISEIVEAIEADRTNKTHDDHLPTHSAIGCELADAVIRCMDLAGELGIDLGQYIVDKLAYNRGRPFRHGNKKY